MNSENHKAALEHYRNILDKLQEKLKTPEQNKDDIESTFLELLTARESLQYELFGHQEQESWPFDSTMISTLFSADEKLFEIGRRVIHEYNLHPGKWRYIVSERGQDHWWWHLDESLTREGDTLVVERPISVLIILSIVLFVLATTLVLLTSQRFWTQGQDFLGYLNLGLQLVVGGGLITEFGQSIATRLLRSIMLIPETIESFFVPHHDYFPLKAPPVNRNRGIFASALVFFLIVVFTAVVLLPSLARVMHNLGLDALERNDISGAQFFLDMSIQLQSDFLQLITTDVTFSLAQLGNLYDEFGNQERAREVYEQALASDSRNVLVHSRLADIYIRDGDYDGAIRLTDQVINMLNDYNAGELLLGFDDHTTPVILLAQAYTVRGKAYLTGYGARAAQTDLVRAQFIIETEHPDLFITPKNDDIDENPPQSAEETIELYLLLGRMFTQLFIERGCPEANQAVVIEPWDAVLDLADDRRQSIQRLWSLEATETRQKIVGNSLCLADLPS